MTINTTPGDPNAVSYATLAQANAYFLERGIAAWAALADGAKESALRLPHAELPWQVGGQSHQHHAGA